MPDNKPPDDIDQSEAEKIVNEWREIHLLARALLFGYGTIDKNGVLLPSTKYLKMDSKDARGSRMAIARILRSGLPLTQDFRDGLAALFDPPRGRRRDDVRDTVIATYVYDCVAAGDSVEKAQEKAADHFGLSSWTVMDIWKRLRKVINFERDGC